MTIKKLLHKTGLILAAGSLFLIFACNNSAPVAIDKINTVSISSEKAYVSLSVKAARNILPTNMTIEDVEEITLSAEKLSSEEKFEAYCLGQDEEEKPVYTLKWTTSEKQSAIEYMTVASIPLDYGIYNFTLNLYTKPTASYVSEYHLSQSGILESFEVNEKTSSIAFETKYVDNGNLTLTFKWAAEDEKTGITSRIGKIEAGLFTVESKGKTAYKNYESLSFAVNDGFNYADYEKTEVPNGSYYLKAKVYDIDGKTLLNTIPLGIVEIKGFKTEKTIELDLTKLNVYYNVNYVFDCGPYPNGKWKNTLSSEQTRRIAYSIFSLPGSDAVEYEGGGYAFKGWYEELDSDGNPIGEPVTWIDSGVDTAHNYTFYAAWEIEESSGSTINVGFDADRSDLTVQLSNNGIIYTYTVTPPDNIETYEYTYFIDGTSYQAETNVITIDTTTLKDSANISIIAVDSKGKSYSYNTSIVVSNSGTGTKETPQGYELKTGLDINPIFNQFVDAASAENKQIIAFAKSATAPADTIEVQYLDTAEANVPVWLQYSGDTAEATIYYYVEEGYKLILSTYCNTMFNGFPDIKTIETSDFYTGNVKYMMYMFAYCYALETLDLSMFDISSVVQLNSMFNSCSALKTIYVNEDADWRYTDIITDSADMFHGCTQLPGYTSASKDKSKAYAGEGGYFTVKE